VVGRFVGEAEEGLVGELEVPFDALPAFIGIPPVTGERKGPVGVGDGSAVRAGEEGEGVLVAIARFGGDVDGDRGTIALQGQGRGRSGSQ
jgi:hypothetical protein